MVTGKLLHLICNKKKISCPISTMTNEMPSIFDHQARCTFKCNRTSPSTALAVQLHSCVFLTQQKSSKASHLLTPWYYPCLHCISEGCKEQVSRICWPKSPACLMSKSMRLVCDAAPVSMDSSQARVERKKEKIASCTPRRRLEAIGFPHKARGKREETIPRLRSFLGQHSQHHLFTTRKSCLKL